MAAGTKVAEGFVEITADLRGLKRSLKTAQRSFSKSLKSIEKNATAAGKKISLALTVPLLAAAFASGKAASKFETNLTKISALVGIAADQVNLLGKAVLKLSPQVAIGPAELSDALFDITSAGFRGAEAMDILTTSARASSSQLGTTKEVAKLLTGAMEAYAKSNLTASFAGSVLNNTVTKGRVEGSELSATLGRLTATAANLEIPFQDVGAAMAVITKTSNSAAEAATLFDGIFRTLLQGTPQFRMELENLGLSFAGVRKEIRDKGLLSALFTLKEAIGDTEGAAGRLFAGEAVKGFLALTEGNVKETIKIFEALEGTLSGDLKKTFDAFAETTAFKFLQAQAAIAVSSIQLGQVILPKIVPIVEKITAAITTMTIVFSKLSPEMQTATINVLALTAVIGPAVIVVGLFAGALLRMGAILAVAFAPVRLIIIAMAALSTTLVSVVGVLVGSFAFLAGRIFGSLTLMAGGALLFKNSMTKNLARVGRAFKTLAIVAVTSMKRVVLALFSIPGAIVAIVAILAVFPNTINAIFSAGFEPAIASVKLSMAKIKKTIVDTINGPIGSLNSLLKALGREPIDIKIEGPTGADIKNLENQVDLAVAASKANIEFGFQVDKEKLKAVTKTVFDFVNDLFKTVKDKAVEVGNAIVEGLTPDALDKLQALLEQSAAESAAILDDIEKRNKKLLEETGGAAENALIGVGKIAEDVSGSISSSITSVITGAMSALNALASVANAIINSIVSTLVGSVGGSGILGSIFKAAATGAAGGTPTPSAKGNVFSGGSVVPFANGGIINNRTTFPMAGGNMGLAGEAGTEAIFPLTRVSGGGLGVSAEGLGGTNVTINQVNNFTSDIKNTVREEIANSAGLIIQASQQATIAFLGGRRT